MKARKRVLHVDDDPALLTVTRAAAQSTPFEFVTVESASDALDAVEAESLDAVVTDSLTTEEGEPLFRAIRDRDPRTPVLLFTAQDREAVSAAGAEGAVTGYVQKGEHDALGELFGLVARVTGEGSIDESLEVPTVDGDATAPSAYDDWERLATHDWGAPEELGTTIVEALSEHGVVVDEFDPLYDVVDPESLERLLEPRHEGAERAEVSARFRFAGYDVAVAGDGTIAVRRMDDANGDPSANGHGSPTEE